MRRKIEQEEASKVVADMVAAIRSEAYFEPPSSKGLTTFFPFLESALPYGAVEVLDWYWPRFLEGVEIDASLFLKGPPTGNQEAIRHWWETADTLSASRLGSLYGTYTSVLIGDVRESRSLFESQDERSIRVAGVLALSTIVFGHVQWLNGDCQDVDDVMRVFYDLRGLLTPRGGTDPKLQEYRIGIDKVLRSRQVRQRRLLTVDC